VRKKKRLGGDIVPHRMNYRKLVRGWSERSNTKEARWWAGLLHSRQERRTLAPAFGLHGDWTYVPDFPRLYCLV